MTLEKKIIGHIIIVNLLSDHVCLNFMKILLNLFTFIYMMYLAMFRHICIKVLWCNFTICFYHWQPDSLSAKSVRL